MSVENYTRNSEASVASDPINYKKWIYIGAGAVVVALFLAIFLLFKPVDYIQWLELLDKNFAKLALVGFLAQLVDGALGMGYGLTCTISLLSLGIPMPAISGSIHTAEMFSSAASGYNHYRLGNVNKKLFRALVITGVIGAVTGAFMLSVYAGKEVSWLKPAIAVYTGLLGLRILYKALLKEQQKKHFKLYGPLALLGGFLDSFGGGGWGPIVTSTLINKGRTPRFVIGTVSLTEFFVTFASSLTFFTMIGLHHWRVIVALVVGGVIASPIAARLAGKLPRRTTMILLALLVLFWSGRILVKLF